MFVAFEGIDGSGKTTLSNEVARALRARGLEVEHVREGGRYASRVTGVVRELGRDLRNLALTPSAEMLLYLAREVQLVDERVRPALRGAQVVIADRSVHSAEVLARFGRGLPEGEVESVVSAMAAGRCPELVFLVDVPPAIARARKRIARISEEGSRAPSRKGLVGAGLQRRLHAGYRALAAREPARWVVVDNADPDVSARVEWICQVIAAALQSGPSAASDWARAHPLSPAVLPPPASTPAEAVEALLGWVEHRAGSDPALAAYFLAGLSGPRIDALRRKLALRAPEVVARGLAGLTDPASWELRVRLSGSAPRQVARSLPRGETRMGARLRSALAAAAPEEVASSLEAMDDDAAWELRAKLASKVPRAVMASLAGLDAPRAWRWREEWLEQAALSELPWAAAALQSVTGVSGAAAWQIRERAEPAHPVAAIASLRGLDDPLAWSLRERRVLQASKAVMQSIAGMTHSKAWALREAAANDCKEALDSMIGLDGPEAWRLREQVLQLWPSTVVKSLGALAHSPRGRELVLDRLRAVQGELSLLKHAAAIALEEERLRRATG